MCVTFNVCDFLRVYDKLVNDLNYDPEIFLTNDLMIIEEKDYEKVKKALPDIVFMPIVW